jgi:hypothetical protein
MADLTARVRRYVPLAAAAEFSGLSISSLRRWVKDKTLTGYRPQGVNGRVLVCLEELDALIRQSAADRREGA